MAALSCTENGSFHHDLGRRLCYRRRVPSLSSSQSGGQVPTAGSSHEPVVVELQGITRRFGETLALAGITLAIRSGEFFSLLGPSGCGKTTLLRLIAGLDYPDAGGLRIGGADALPVPPHQRPVNTVFQSYALFPHMTVWENVAFGLKMRKVPRAAIQTRVARMLELVQISPLASRKPAQLSGGEKQRVALARAVVNEPQVLLLDEPLGALDLKLRRQLQTELHDLQRRLGLTFIYVTHDQDEALTMSDRIAVMNAGRIEQVGVAEQLYENPRNRFVAQFLGGCNLLEASFPPLGPSSQGSVLVQTVLGSVRMRAPVSSNSLPSRTEPGAKVTLAIRPEKILVADQGSGENWFPVTIHDTTYTGAETHYQVRAGPQMIKVVVMNRPGQPRLEPGQAAWMHLPPESLVLLED